MLRFFREFVFQRFGNAVKNGVNSVREINAKYAEPQLKTGFFVKFSLLCLRLYLILLLGILVFKFYTIFKK
jgi:hypothetical protein